MYIFKWLYIVIKTLKIGTNSWMKTGYKRICVSTVYCGCMYSQGILLEVVWFETYICDNNWPAITSYCYAIVHTECVGFG